LRRFTNVGASRFFRIWLHTNQELDMRTSKKLAAEIEAARAKVSAIVALAKQEEREMNADELAQLQADQAEALARQEAQAAKAANKAALLERLGITAEEAKLLLS
jgi:hypothetical protein